jgi:hypothetical protein
MPKREALSKTPSWVMLGVLIGGVIGYTAKTHWDNRSRAEAEAAAAVERARPTPTPTPLPPPPSKASLTDLEAVFQRWQARAVWRNDVTEVAFWDPASNQFSEYVEILRNGDDYYFRSIPHLTRPFSEETMPKEAPLRFTDPEAHPERHLRLTFPNP